MPLTMVRVRRPDLRMVEGVERLAPRFQPDTLAEPELARYRHVHVEVAATAEVIVPGVAELPGRVRHENSGVQVLIREAVSASTGLHTRSAWLDGQRSAARFSRSVTDGRTRLPKTNRGAWRGTPDVTRF